jgi:hypothetical protein
LLSVLFEIKIGEIMPFRHTILLIALLQCSAFHVNRYQHKTSCIKSNANNGQYPLVLEMTKQSSSDKMTNHITTMVTAMSLLFSVAMTPDAAIASDRAAQVSLDKIPPTTISIQIQDLPVIGNVLSGYYTKVDKAAFKGIEPSIVIQSPKDKIGAISAIAKGGHLEFDVNGKLSTHLDVDVAADEAGKLKVLVQSNLIPKLPFKNMASSAFTTPIVNGKESPWNIVTNLGTGESYYYNAKSGVTQYERPERI